MYCSNCGREIPEGSRFCNHCGAAQNMVGDVYQKSQKKLVAISIIIASLLAMIGVIFFFFFKSQM
jgi:hypothetical protein